MRNMRALMMIVLSLVAGIAAVTLASRWLASQTVVATNKVAVAAIDVGAGQPLKAAATDGHHSGQRIGPCEGPPRRGPA